MTSTPGVDVATRLGAAVRASSRSSRARPTSTRARRGRSRTAFGGVEEWLTGWDANGAEWDFWVERNEAFVRRSRGCSTPGRRRRGHDVGLAGCERARLGAAARPGAEPDRDQRVRVPDRRADRACAGAARRRGRARPAGADGSMGRAVRRGDRRADGARLLHDGLVPVRSPPRRRRDRRPRRTRRARSCSPTATRRAARSSSTSGRSAPTWYGRHGQVPAGHGRPRLHVGAAGAPRSLLPTQTGWFADEDIFAMSIADYSPHASARRFDSGTPPVPALYAGVAGSASSGDRRAGRRGARPRSRRSPARRARRARGDRCDTARAAARGPLVCVRSTDVPSLVAALAAERIVTRCATRTCGSPSTSTTSTTTSTGSSRRCTVTAGCSPDSWRCARSCRRRPASPTSTKAERGRPERHVCDGQLEDEHPRRGCVDAAKSAFVGVIYMYRQTASGYASSVSSVHMAPRGPKPAMLTGEVAIQSALPRKTAQPMTAITTCGLVFVRGGTVVRISIVL